MVADANRYFAGEAPWALAKTDPARQGTVLYVTAEVVRQVAILAQPFMPESAAKLLDLLGVPADERDFAALGDSRRIAAGTPLPAPAPVFPRYVEPEAASSARRDARCWSTAIAISIFRTSPTSSTASSAARARPASAAW